MGLIAILSLIVVATTVRLIFTYEVAATEDESRSDETGIEENARDFQTAGVDEFNEDYNLFGDSGDDGMTTDDLEYEKEEYDLIWTDEEDLSLTAYSESNETADDDDLRFEESMAAYDTCNSKRPRTAPSSLGADTFLLDIRENGKPIRIEGLHREDGLILLHKREAPPTKVIVSASAGDPSVFKVTADGTLVAEVTAPDGLNGDNVNLIAYARVEEFLAGLSR